MSEKNQIRPLLEVKDLSVQFKTDEGEAEALDKVSFDIHPGQTVGVVGESGCGKSVTAYSIMRLLPRPMGMISNGSILFQGKNLLDLDTEEIKVLGELSLKILIIAPNKRLSWQYHNRRSEMLKVFSGEIKVITSYDDIERNEEIFKEGDKIRLSKGERHRIIGLEEYAVVAEIWIHTDKNNPSDENDIIRIQDDFNRN